MTPDKFAARLQSWIDQWQVRQAKFLQDFAQNPSYALAWADSTFQAAGRYEVAMQFKAYWDQPPAEGDTRELKLHACKETCDRELTRMASQFNQSTSPSSNQMDRAKLAAFASLFDYWG